MTSNNLTARRGSSAATLYSSAASSQDLVAEPHWFGTARGVSERNTRYLIQETLRLQAHTARCTALASLVDARVTVASKLADLENVLIEIQRQKDHERWRSERTRESERMQAAYDFKITMARKEAELAKASESVVRAQRNCEAAERVKETEIDVWHAEAQARRNNAEADRQDTAADLNRTTAAPAEPDAIKTALAAELAQLFATLDDQIELEKQRGNQHAVLALQNARARLKAAA